MSDTDDDDVLFARRPMSAVSATTLITTLVADADATTHKLRPTRKHRVYGVRVMKYLRRRECYGAYNSWMRDLSSLDVI